MRIYILSTIPAKRMKGAKKLGGLFTLQDGHFSVEIGGELPPVNPCADYQYGNFSEFSKRLNDAKSLLDPFYNRAKSDTQFYRRWFDFQSVVDFYKGLRGIITNEYNGQLVSNAWLKYFEIYSHYHFREELHKRFGDGKPVKAFFNAELPGAALCAWNHYMRMNGESYEWVASSLLAEDSRALGDSYGLYEMNLDHWLMQVGKNDGDATKVSNLRMYEETLAGSIHFYSHDAGIDVSEDFSAQEESNARIHLGCALAGLMTLRPGGLFVAKQYTFFNTFTWNLLLIYSGLFEKFYVCKPLTSRPYNSETYLVGVGYKGISAELKQTLLSRLENFSLSPFFPFDAVKSSPELMARFMELEKFAERVFGLQSVRLTENIRAANKYLYSVATLRRLVLGEQKKLLGDWLRKYPVKPLDQSQYLPSAKIRI